MYEALQRAHLHCRIHKCLNWAEDQWLRGHIDWFLTLFHNPFGSVLEAAFLGGSGYSKWVSSSHKSQGDLQDPLS